jgi:hypothetical protein
LSVTTAGAGAHCQAQEQEVEAALLDFLCNRRLRAPLHAEAMSEQPLVRVAENFFLPFQFRNQARCGLRRIDDKCLGSNRWQVDS